MQSGNDRRWYGCVDAALLRATVAVGETTLPPWPSLRCPDTASAAQWRAWLRLAWAGPRAAEVVEIASPVLARRIEAVIGGAEVDARRARRMALSLARYLLRAGSRATPYGVFAGVAPARFAATPEVRFGEHHQVRARPDGQWLDTVVTALESDPALLARLPVTANALCRRRGGRLWVPGGSAFAADGTAGPAEVCMRLTPAVALTLAAATLPVYCGDLAGKLAAEFPATPAEKINRLIVELVEYRVLVSALRAPSTITDPLGHLLAVLLHAHEASGVAHLAPLVRGLHEIHTRMAGSGRAEPSGPGRAARTAVMDRMREPVPVTDAPLAVDLGLDARATLPDAVAREVEAAATVLARLASHPHGTAAWRDYAERFRQRYGVALVPVTELTDPVMGLGYPAGYPGSGPERPASRTVRDERLLAYAQLAALDGVSEVVLTETMIHELEEGQDPAPIRIPPHLEVCIQLHAVSMSALALGEFTARVLGVSRAAGTMTGRFLHLLDVADQARMAEVYAGLPTVDGAGVAVQLSFPPLRSCADHVTRAQRILPSVISLGEYPDPAVDLIPLKDLAVGWDNDRLYLASLATGRVLEAMVPTSLNYRTQAHTADDGTAVSSASSPHVVATMLEQLDVASGHRVLEIGAATGINAALLAELVGPTGTGTVITIELDDDLAAGARTSLTATGYDQVEVRCGDGALGHPARAPYDRIIVTAGAWDIVSAWWRQLAVGGRLVVPLRRRLRPRQIGTLPLALQSHFCAE